MRGACRLSFNRKVLLLNKNRSAEDRNSKEGLFTKLVTLAAGGESRERDSFLIEDANLHAPRTG